MTPDPDSTTGQFLAELGELSNKYGIWINGCGCCGSPFLEDSPTWKNATKRYADDLKAREDGTYTCTIGDEWLS